MKQVDSQAESLAGDSLHNDTLWQKAFRWLTTLELNTAPSFDEFPTGAALHGRVQALAILFDLLPRTEVATLPMVILAWERHFGEATQVTLPDLRRVTRTVLKTPAAIDTREDLKFWALRLSGCDQHTDLRWPSTSGTMVATANDRELCAAGLWQWFRELGENAQWSTLPGLLTDDPPRSIKDVYVELCAVEERDVIQQVDDSLAGGEGGRYRAATTDIPPLNLEGVISRTIDGCLVVGDPGCGKSTLVKWLAWKAFQQQLIDFDFAVVVKLSAYAAALEQFPKLTPLEFFFQSLGQSPVESCRAAIGLQEIARESQRCLLLLDGWDEVQPALRPVAKERLQELDRAFVTLITSRPAGFPRQLLQQQRGDYYRVAGLTPQAGEQLTTQILKPLTSERVISGIWTQIQTDRQLRELATNPFLLSLVVRAIWRSHIPSGISRADIYQELIESLRQQYNDRRDTAEPLTVSHLAGLEGLSHRLLLSTETPRYLFTELELESAMPSGQTRAVLQSRLITRPYANLDELSLLHATIQEFLAAMFLTRLPEQPQSSEIERLFRSTSRFIVLEFLVGLGGPTAERCREFARHWWQERDRFGQFTLRLARLATSGHWPRDELQRAVRNALWQDIVNEEQIESCERAVRAFAESDPQELVQRAHRARLSNWALKCIKDAVPPHVAQEQQLAQLLRGDWFDDGSEHHQCAADPSDAHRLRQQLSSTEHSVVERQFVLRQMATLPRDFFLPEVQQLVRDDRQPTELRQEALTTLARWGGESARETLLEILLGQHGADDTLRRRAAIAFVQPAFPQVRLDPKRRDRILRRLAAIPPTNPAVERFLTALKDVPIRDGATIIAELAQSSALLEGVRRTAIQVLGCVTDRQLLAQLLSRISEQPIELLGDWINVGLRRALPIPLDWLELQVQRSRDRLQRHRLLQVLVQVLAYSNVAVRTAHFSFLEARVTEAFDPKRTDGDGALALTSALDHLRSPDVLVLGRNALKAALSVIAGAAEGRTTSRSQQVQLAIAIVRHFRDTSSVSLLEQFLDLRRTLPCMQDDPCTFAAAKALVEITPEALLRQPQDCPVVTSVLRSQSLLHGWMVYFDRILDAEGRLIAAITSRTNPVIAPDRGDIPMLMDRLSAKARAALELYWLMIRPGSRCHPKTPYPQIHETAAQIWGDGEDSPLGQELTRVFERRFPTYAAWKRLLTRIERQFANERPLRELLVTLGLYRRR